MSTKELVKQCPHSWNDGNGPNVCKLEAGHQGACEPVTASPVLARELSESDLTDGSISALERCLILRSPQALSVAKMLAEIKGRPLGNRILVLPLPPDERIGNIYIPENARANQNCGIVVAVGRGTYQNGCLVPPQVRIGNFVIFSKYAAEEIDVGGTKVFRIDEGSISFAAGD